MADDLIARAEVALEGVTPGPWAVSSWDRKTILSGKWASDEGPPDERGEFTAFHASKDEDARFIAVSRELVPALVARVRELEEALRVYRKLAELSGVQWMFAAREQGEEASYFDARLMYATERARTAL